MSKRKSAILPEQIPNLQGSLTQTEIVDILQFLQSSGKSGELMLKNLPENQLVRLYFQKGELIHAASENVEGLDAMWELPRWSQGDFLFLPDILSSKTTIELPLPHVILEIMKHYDETNHVAESHGGLQSEDEQSEDVQETGEEVPAPELEWKIESTDKDEEEKETQEAVQGPKRRRKMATLRDLLDDLVRIEGINTAVLVGRDGFVIDGIQSGGSLDVEDIGAVISTGIGSSEIMGNELAVGTLSQTMVEFEKGIVLVNLVGDNAILAVVADLKTPLGNVRYQVKKRLPDIREKLES